MVREEVISRFLLAVYTVLHTPEWDRTRPPRWTRVKWVGICAIAIREIDAAAQTWAYDIVVASKWHEIWDGLFQQLVLTQNSHTGSAQQSVWGNFAASLCEHLTLLYTWRLRFSPNWTSVSVTGP